MFELQEAFLPEIAKSYRTWACVPVVFLQDYQLFLSSNSSNEGGGLTAGAAAGAAGGGSSGGGGALFGERSASSFGRRDSRLTSGGGSSGGAAMVGRALRGALSGISGGVAGGVGGASGSSLAAVGRSSSLAAGAGGLLQAQSLIGMQALLDHHFAICRWVFGCPWVGLSSVVFA